MPRTALLDRTLRPLLASCAMGLALAAAGTAHGQAFQGNAEVVVGNVNFNKSEIGGNKYDFITLNSPEAVINWVPFDDGGASTPIDFLPENFTAQFASTSDFTVLNRIFSPNSRAIGLNGNVFGRVGNDVGGNVWFYSPAGIIAGNKSVFAVGGLILTANDIPFTDGVGIDYNTDGLIPFRAAAGSTASVVVEPGAIISPNGADSYVALVAPRVVQGGQIKLDGSVAMVAAEEVDIRINQGLFDIVMITGTSVTEAIVHSGTTGEAPDSGDVTGAQRVYLAAMPKNDAITMLVGGSLGTSAINAVQADRSVILSGGHDIGDTSGIGLISTPNNDTPVDIRIGTATFGSILTGLTSGTITASPARGEQLRFEGEFSSLTGARGVSMAADLDESIFSAGSVDLSSPVSTTLRLGVTNADPGSGTTGANVEILGGLSLTSDGFGLTDFGIGSDGAGGIASILMEGDGPAPTLSVGGPVSVSAVGNGGYGSGRGGAGVGGTAEIVNAGGTLTIQGLTAIGAAGIGGPTAGEDGIGGAGFGGTARFVATGGKSTLTGLSVDAASIGAPGSGNAVNGGADGTNSLASILVSGATTTVSAGDAHVTAQAFGFAGAENSDPLTGGTARIEVLDGAAFAVSNILYADAGTQAALDSAFASPKAGPVARAGTVEVTSSGTLTAETGQFAADTVPLATIGDSASGTGGTVKITARDSGTFEGSMAFGTGLFGSADGVGASGGTGGTVTLIADGGSIDSANVIGLSANGKAGTPTSGGIASGLGGSIGIVVHAGGAKAGISFAELSAQATGSAALEMEGEDFSISDGGLGKGGFVALDIDGGSMTGGILSLTAQGFGGYANVFDTPTASHIAGTGEGGIVQIQQSGGTIDIGTLTADAGGFGGSALDATKAGLFASAAGSGKGGVANIVLGTGTLKIDTATVMADGTGGRGGAGSNGGVASAGGEGRGGEANLSLQGGALAAGSITLSAAGEGGVGGIDDKAGTSGAGGGGIGGLAATKIMGGDYAAAQTNVAAVGTGGAGGDNAGTGLSGTGGAAMGGTASFQALADMPALAGVTVVADGIGGAGGSGQTLVFDNGTGQFVPVPGLGKGGAGGVGSSGFASLTVDLDPVIDTVTISASGKGGAGGNGVTGGKGGDGFGGPQSPNGSASLQVLFGELTAGTVQIASNGTGGKGGNGTAGAGGAGGSGTGGDTLVRVRGVDARLIVGGGAVQAVGMGGAAGTGTSGNAAGGNGAGGRARVHAQEGGTLGGALAVSIDAAGIGRDGSGAGGAGGSGIGGDAMLEIVEGKAEATGAPPEGLTITAIGRGGGSTGGEAGDGKGGTAHFLSMDGSFALGALTLTADGAGGDATGAGAGGEGAGGNANFLSSGLADVVAGALTLRASGIGGLSDGQPGGAATAGLALVGDPVNGPNASIRLDSVTATIGGANAPAGSGFSFDNSGPILVTKDFRVTTDGGATFTTTGGGTLTVGGTAAISAGGDIRLTHVDQPAAPVTTIAAAGTLDLRAGRDIIGTGTVIVQGDPVRMVAARDLLGPAMRILSPATLGLFVGRDFSIGTIDVGGPLDTLDDQGNVAVAGTLTLPVAVTVADLLRVRNAPATIRTPGDIRIGAAVSPGIDLATTGGTITLGSLAGPGGDAQFATLSAPSLSLGSLKVSDDITLTATTGAITATALDAGDGITVTGAGDVTLGIMAAGSGISLDAAGSATIDSVQTGKAGAISLDAAQGLTVAKIDAAGTVALKSANGAVTVTTDIKAAGQASALGTAVTLNAAQGLDLDSAQATAGALSVKTAGALTLADGKATDDMLLASGGTATVGAVQTGGDLSIDAAQGMTATKIDAAGAVALQSAAGAVTVTTDIKAGGQVSATGTAVTLNAAQGLNLSSARATAGALTVKSAGALALADGKATGDIALASSGGTVAIGSAQAGGDLSVAAAGAATIDTLATGNIVKITSGDIAIGGSGRIGTAGTTTLVELTNGDTGRRSFFGGAVNDGYSLSNDEIGRLFADNITLIAPRTAASAPTNPDVVLGTMNVTSRANNTGGQLGAQGALTIQTAGRVRVNGAVALTGAGDGNSVAIQGGDAIEIDAAGGSIDLRGPNNALAGTIRLSAADIVAASAATTTAVLGSTDPAEIGTRLGTNDGPVVDEGFLRARGLRFTVTNGLYIQNSGAGTEAGQRRGFTAGPDGVTIGATQGASPRIAINGQLTSSTGVLATGLEAIPLVTVNGQPAPSAAGYAQGSTINGCIFANADACRPVVRPDEPAFTMPRERIEGPVETGSDDRRPVPRIEIEDFESFGYQPLIDEPVTGSGNDDLWTQDCDPAKEGDCPPAPAPRTP